MYGEAKERLDVEPSIARSNSITPPRRNAFLKILAESADLWRARRAPSSRATTHRMTGSAPER
ncbi:hypothetical protein ACIBHX_35260 [Nonomuraea sp. NPDC050536]|uniref:hypothetical protein n=1 Tax=Nonomuraea sp. NPDC050536 TaxID=3364366 RepID=UPI0037CA4C57